MAAPSTTTWELEPHTRAKHEILKRYLQAWMPILSQGKFPELLYVDGFAGPGEYKGGEDGSPIIALKTALGYDPPLTAKMHFLFVEKEKDRADHLRSIIEDMSLPKNFDVIVEGGTTFEEAFKRHLPNYLRSSRLHPTFGFIDPFGWSGAPFSLVKEIMRHRSCEVFVNFMYEEVNRFLGHPDQGPNFDAFFGTSAWRDCEKLIEPQARNRCLHDLYMQQLHEAANVSHVRSFEMRNERDVTDYYLFYGTNSLQGLAKMKEAMWRIDESGEFSFSDATDPSQLVLFEKTPNFSSLRLHILEKFSGSEATVQEIEDFVIAGTAFHKAHYKRVLKSLEISEHKLVVINAQTRADPAPSLTPECWFGLSSICQRASIACPFPSPPSASPRPPPSISSSGCGRLR